MCLLCVLNRYADWRVSVGQSGRCVWTERGTNHGHAAEWSVRTHCCLQPKLPLLPFLQTGQRNRVGDKPAYQERAFAK